MPPYRFKEPVTVLSVPDPLPRTDVQEVPQPQKENLKILASALSKCGQYVALADDHKQLTVWQWKQEDGNLKLIKQWNIVRRANKIIFDESSTNVLIAGNMRDNRLIIMSL